MSISFKKVELEAYPNLPLILDGLTVKGLPDSDYDGLVGEIVDIKYGADKETENDTVLDIVVNFSESDFYGIEQTHPHLNGTSLSEVICGEDELGFKFTNDQPLFITIKGQVICSGCNNPMEKVRETQNTDIMWSFENGNYVVSNDEGDSNGKRCDICDEVLDIADEEIFAY